MDIKLLSWNILSGGFDSYGDKTPYPQRMDGIVSAVRGIGADLVTLVDTHQWIDRFLTNILAEMFGYERLLSVKLEDERLIARGHDNGITVLSRLPIQQMAAIRLSTRNGIRTTVTAGGKEIDLFSVYLDDLNEDVRLDQTRAILGMVRDDVATIIMGDLNSIDELDLGQVKKDQEALYDRIPQLRSTMEPVIREMTRAQVTRELAGFGFTDLGKGRGNTFPTPLFPVDAGKPMARVDYIFSRGVKPVSFEVLRDKELDKLSDHYPILAEVEI